MDTEFSVLYVELRYPGTSFTVRAGGGCLLNRTCFAKKYLNEQFTNDLEHSISFVQ